jgi:TldD protein
MDGVWNMPVQQDPFSVPAKEKLEFLRAAGRRALDIPGVRHLDVKAEWARQEKTFASTDGSFLTQTLYTALGGFSGFRISVSDTSQTEWAEAAPERFYTTGRGYEVLTEGDFTEEVVRSVETAKASLVGRTSPQPGRWDCVFDGRLMTSVVDHTLAKALDLDRAVGYEANGGGTSYLAPPDRILGMARVAPEFITVTANRSEPRGAATVKWDDEGVEPEARTLVERGVVTDYCANREQASWLAQWSHQRQRPARSRGDANAPNAFSPPVAHLPNIGLEPGAADDDFHDLVAQVRDGVAFVGGRVSYDQELTTGLGFPVYAYEIKNGKLGRPLRKAGFNYRTQDLWKNIVAIGGQSSRVVGDLIHGKGANFSIHTPM